MKTTRKKSAPALSPASSDEAAIIEAAHDLLSHIKAGTTRNLRATDVTLPERLPARNAGGVRRLRESLGVSQAVFAGFLNVPARTVISWENGQRKPSGAALKLLDIAEKHPKALGVTTAEQ